MDQQAKFFKAAGDEPPPKSNTSGTALLYLIPLGAIMFLFAVFYVLPTAKEFYRSRQVANQHAADRSDALLIARALVKEHLRSPSTAKWPKTEILEQKDRSYLVHIWVDAQNAYGTEVRGSYLVALKFVGKDDYFTHTKFGVQTAERRPTKDEIMVMKALNNWGENGIEYNK